MVQFRGMGSWPLTALIALAGAAGCGTAQTAARVPIAPEPHVWPTAYPTGGVCAIAAPVATAKDPTQLPTNAESADLLWYPGLNAHPCHDYRTHLGAAQADQLLMGIKGASRPQPGAVYHCPMDDGSFVEVWFITTKGDASIRIGLRGCGFYLPPLADLGTWPNAMTLTR